MPNPGRRSTGNNQEPVVRMALTEFDGSTQSPWIQARTLLSCCRSFRNACALWRVTVQWPLVNSTGVTPSAGQLTPSNGPYASVELYPTVLAFLVCSSVFVWLSCGARYDITVNSQP